MCMSSVDFTLEWNEELKDYVGYGYKEYDHNMPTNVWLESGPDISYNCLKYRPDRTISGPYKIRTNHDDYAAGFHIFLRKEDAERYAYSGRVQRVCFTSVIAFGKNGAGMFNNELVQGDCIIARYMWAYPREAK